jgi:hypothetical protein
MANRRVVVLVDGTWCGPETNTKSNIHEIAKLVGINPTETDTTYTSTNVYAKYFPGVGLGGDFMSYLWDGALATHIEKDCTEVYNFIVQNYVAGSEIWMFGLSRGAYIVRSVAGMINNCGVVRDKQDGTLIKQIYSLYRSPYPVNEPDSPEMQRFRSAVSHQVLTPIKFMGILDTVGSLGIPRLNADTGTGFEWPEFHDNLVSSVVEKVYHALAMHDRLWPFQPCLASRDVLKHQNRPELTIRQKWFPGTHYDIARQEFQFFREGRAGLEGIVSSILNIFSRTISPNDQLADLVLWWILGAVRTEGGGDMISDRDDVNSTIHTVIDRLQTDLPTKKTGVGDIYTNITLYLPLGNILFIPATLIRLTKSLLYQILFNPQDRVIPDPGNPANTLVQNEAYNYTIADCNLNNVTIGDTAQVGTLVKQNERYPSKTYQNYTSYMISMGRQP